MITEWLSRCYSATGAAHLLIFICRMGRVASTQSLPLSGHVFSCYTVCMSPFLRLNGSNIQTFICNLQSPISFKENTFFKYRTGWLIWHTSKGQTTPIMQLVAIPCYKTVACNYLQLLVSIMELHWCGPALKWFCDLLHCGLAITQQKAT